MPNPPKELTPKELEEIETMAGLGMRYEDIASLKGMCDDTLKKYAGEALKRGKAKAKAQVMQTAYKMAVSGKTPAMTMFWLKTQACWRENSPDIATCLNLAETIKNSDKPTQAIVTCLAETIEQVKTGELDPRTASSIASVAGAFMKAVAQGSLEDRLAVLESITQSQTPEPLDLDL